MSEQQNAMTNEQCRYPALPADLVEVFKHRPLTAKEVTQWLTDCIRQAESAEQLQDMGEHATGILRAMCLCWVISTAEHEVTTAELNVIYGDRYRELAGVALH